MKRYWVIDIRCRDGYAQDYILEADHMRDVIRKASHFGRYDGSYAEHQLNSITIYERVKIDPPCPTWLDQYVCSYTVSNGWYRA